MNSEIITEILDRGKDDWIDFAEVLAIVRSRKRVDGDAALSLSLDVIREMLEQSSVLVGELQKRGNTVAFAAWNDPSRKIVERIQANLATLGHRPGIGEVCWLSTM